MFVGLSVFDDLNVGRPTLKHNHYFLDCTIKNNHLLAVIEKLLPSFYVEKGFWGMLRSLSSELSALSFIACSGSDCFSVAIKTAEVQRLDRQDDVAACRKGFCLGVRSVGVSARAGVSFECASDEQSCGKILDSLLFYVEHISLSGDWENVLPLYFPEEGEFAEFNRELSSGRNAFFLNGLPESGRGRFLDRLLLFRGLSISDIVNVPEIAELEFSRQEELVAAVESGVLVCISSVYPLAPMLQGGLVLPALAPVLEESRILFSSRSPLLAREREFWAGFSRSGRLEFSSAQLVSTRDGLRDAVEKLEIEAIHEAYRRAGRSQNKVAALLGISRGSLQHKLRKYQIGEYPDE